MVGSIRPSVNGPANPPQSSHLAAGGGGDGPWVQPAATEDAIVSPHMKIDPSVLRNMAKQPKAAAHTSANTKKNGENGANGDSDSAGRRSSSRNKPRKTFLSGSSRSRAAEKKKETSPPKQKVVDVETEVKENEKKDVIPDTSRSNTVVPNTDLKDVATVSSDVSPVVVAPQADVVAPAPSKMSVVATPTPPVSTPTPPLSTPTPPSNLSASIAVVPNDTAAHQRRPADLPMNLNATKDIATADPDIEEPSTNYFSADYNYPSGVQRDTAALGRDLYLRFLHEEMRTVHVREPPCMDPWRAARLDLDYTQSLNGSVRVRKSLRQVADVFARSEHRRRVRQQAAEVNLQSLNYNSFQEMLGTLFQEGGMTSERVIVLFYFCADLTIRALNEQMTGCFHQLIEWSQVYIVDTLSVWVQQNGGWSAVLDQSASLVYSAAKLGLVCASVIALCIFIQRSR